MKKNLKYYLVIPAYNEASRISEVIKAAKKEINNIVVVDDGSTDDLELIINKLNVIYLRHGINLGKGAAMKTGAEVAFMKGADTVIFMDGDGQHDPCHISEFVTEISKGNDIVFGSRNLSSGVPIIRYLGNKCGSVLINLFFGIYRSDLLCGYMAMTKKTFEKINWESSRYGVETEIVAKTGKNKLKYSEIPMKAIYTDNYKGVTILDAVGIVFRIPKWIFK